MRYWVYIWEIVIVDPKLSPKKIKISGEKRNLGLERKKYLFNKT